MMRMLPIVRASDRKEMVTVQNRFCTVTGCVRVSEQIGGNRMADQFQGNVDTLFKGMENFVTSKTCVGDPIRIGDTIILPLVDVSFGLLASTKNEKERRNGGGGMGGKMTPTALLIIKDGSTRMVNVKNQDSLSRLIDIVPDLIQRFTSKNKVVTTPEEDKVVESAAKEETTF
jgi:uncharacterized spore protein YtfJ